jgi:hypothetical protein
MPNEKEEQLTRVLKIAGLPDFTTALANRNVNVPKLLELRESSECLEFRQWISTLGLVSDKEVKERVTSIRARLGNLIQAPEGRFTRLLVTTGLGLIPGLGTVAGVAAGIVDTFLLEKILPNSGPLAFVSKLYGSVFEQRQ